MMMVCVCVVCVCTCVHVCVCTCVHVCVCVCLSTCECMYASETENQEFLYRFHVFQYLLVNKSSFYRRKFWMANKALLNHLIDLAQFLHYNLSEGD